MEEKKSKRKMNVCLKIIIAILILIGIAGVTFSVDFFRVQNQKKPIFVVYCYSVRDGGSKVYKGLGYTVVAFHIFDPALGDKSNSVVIGPFFKDFDEFRSELYFETLGI